MTKRSISESITEIVDRKLNVSDPASIVDLANALDTISSDIYSKQTRFIYELIQNADDASEGSNVDIDIEIINNYLVVSHTGSPFSTRDIEGLCGVNHGTKKSNSKTIGYKGIGFKSVFTQKAANVYVYTDGEVVQFNKVLANKLSWKTQWGDVSTWERSNDRHFKAPWQILPLKCKELPCNIESAVSGRNVATIIELDNINKTKNDISDLFKHIQFILFLSNTRSITLKLDDTTKVYTKNIDKNGIVELVEDSRILSYWWLYDKTNNISSTIKKELSEDSNVPVKLKEARNVSITLAYELNKEDGNYSIKPIEDNDSRLYSYLPTEVTEFKFPFLVNSNFLVDASREKIMNDHAWNHWLFECIGFQMIESAREICHQEFTVSSNLTGICIRKPKLLSKSLDFHFSQGMNEATTLIPFVKNNDGALVKISSVLIDQSGLSQVHSVDSSVLKSHISKNIGNFPLSNMLSCDKTAETILNKLGAENFTKENLLEFISSADFSEEVNVTSAYDILLLVKSHTDKASRLASISWGKLLPLTPLLLTSNDDYLPISQICEPVDGEDETWAESIDTVHDELYTLIKNNEELYIWLQNQGFKKPSRIAFLETQLLQNLSTLITSENHIRIFDYLFNLHTDGFLTEAHYEKLSQVTLRNLDGEFNAVHECALCDDYNPRVRPRKFGESIPLICPDYIGNKKVEDVKDFLIQLGAVDNLNMITLELYADDFDDEYLEFAADLAKDGHDWPDHVTVQKAKDGRKSLHIDCFGFLPPSSKKFLAEYWSQVFSAVDIDFVKTEEFVEGDKWSALQAWDTFSINDSTWLAADRMRWGNYSTNWTGIYPYIRYLAQERKVLPSINHGLKTATQLLVNSPENNELARDILPVIDAPVPLSDGWVEYLQLKRTIDVHGFVEILKELPDIELEGGPLYDYVATVYRALCVYLEELDDWEGCLDELAVATHEKLKLLCLDGKFIEMPICIIDQVEKPSDAMNNLLFAPSECVFNERFRYLFEGVLQVRFADGVSISHNGKRKNISLKARIIENLPYLLAYNECHLKSAEITEVLEKFEAMDIFECTSIHRDYWLDKQKVHSIEHMVVEHNDAVYMSLPVSNLTAPQLSYPIAKCLGLDEQVSVVQSILVASQEDLVGINLSGVAACWLDDILTNPQYQSMLDSYVDKEPLVETEHIKASEIHQGYRLKSLDKETQILSSQQSILEAVNYLKNELRVGVDDCKKAIEKFVDERKITADNGLIFHVRSAKGGTVYLSYTVWSDLSGVDSELMVFVSGSTEPRFFSTQQALIDACITERVSIEMEHEGDVNRIEDMFSGEFARRPYSEIPSTHLAFELSGNIQVSNFGAGVFQEYLDEDLNGGVLDELS
jgi:hypothetical protein